MRLLIYTVTATISAGGITSCRSHTDEDETTQYDTIASGEGTLSQISVQTTAGNANSADAAAIRILEAPDLANQDTAQVLNIKDGLIAGGPSVAVTGAGYDGSLLLSLQRDPWLGNIGERGSGAPSLLTAKLANLKGDHTMEMNKNLAVVYQLKQEVGSRFGFINHQELDVTSEQARFPYRGTGIYQLVYVWDSNANIDPVDEPEKAYPIQ